MMPPKQPPVLTMPLIAMVSRCPTVIVAPQKDPSVSSRQPKQSFSVTTAAYGLDSQIVIHSNRAVVVSPARGTIRNPQATPSRLHSHAARAPPAAAPAAAASGGAAASPTL